MQAQGMLCASRAAREHLQIRDQIHQEKILHDSFAFDTPI